MKNCQNCFREIFDSSSVCPYCHYSYPLARVMTEEEYSKHIASSQQYNPHSKRNRFILIFSIFVIVVACFTLFRLGVIKCTNHIAFAAYCTSERHCLLCGTVVHEKLPHDVPSFNCVGYAICERCNKSVVIELKHDAIPATCEQPSKCSLCDKQLAYIQNHTFISRYGKMVCKYCLKTECELNGHNYVNDVCTNCKIHLLCADGKHNYQDNICIFCGDVDRDLYLELVDTDYSYGYKTYRCRIKNFHSSKTYSFVEVRLELLDENKNEIYSDWTYAVGIEGIRPGASDSFKFMVDTDDLYGSVEYYRLSIIDYD